MVSQFRYVSLSSILPIIKPLVYHKSFCSFSKAKLFFQAFQRDKTLLSTINLTDYTINVIYEYTWRTPIIRTYLVYRMIWVFFTVSWRQITFYLFKFSLWLVSVYREWDGIFYQVFTCKSVWNGYVCHIFYNPLCFNDEHLKFHMYKLAFINLF